MNIFANCMGCMTIGLVLGVSHIPGSFYDRYITAINECESNLPRDRGYWQW